MDLYEPESPPSENTASLANYAYRELTRVAALLNAVALGQLNETFVAPAKPRTGMLRLADGTQWNPGGGRGVYWYDETLPGWVQI